MTVAFTSTDRDIRGSKRVETGTLAFDNSYPTGGESVPLSLMGLLRATEVRIGPSGGYVFEYVPSTSKVKVYWVDTTVDGAAMAEVADTTDLSALTAVPIVAVGV